MTGKVIENANVGMLLINFLSPRPSRMRLNGIASIDDGDELVDPYPAPKPQDGRDVVIAASPVRSFAINPRPVTPPQRDFFEVDFRFVAAGSREWLRGPMKLLPPRFGDRPAAWIRR